MEGIGLIYQNISLEDLPNEVWISIIGFEGYYQVSNMGRVKSLARVVKHPIYGDKKVKESILVQIFLKSKYLFVNLYKDGVNKVRRVNRLVALHHIENPENKPEVNHKKGIKTDNRASELEWVTRIENITHSIATGLSKGFGENSNFYGLTGSKSYQAKKINQYSLTGNFIKTWDCIEDAVKATGMVRSSVSRTGYSKGFAWIINPENNKDLDIKKHGRHCKSYSTTCA